MQTIAYDRAAFGRYVQELAFDRKARGPRLADRWQVLTTQHGRLDKVIRRAFASSPYYRQLARERRLAARYGIRAFRQIPLLTRQLYRTNVDLLKVPVEETCFRDSTSGTAGTPIEVFRDSRSLFFESARLGDMFEYYVGHHRSRPEVILYVSHYATSAEHIYYDPVLRAHTAKVRCDLENVSQRAQRLGVHLSDGAFVLTGTVSSLQYLVNSELARFGLPAPLLVMPSGEYLPSSLRTQFSTTFQAPVFELYTLRECGTIAFQCRSETGLHVHADAFVLEVVNDSGCPVSDGHIGEVVISDLNNYHLPLLRYTTGDSGSMQWTECNCGVVLPTIYDFRGRKPTRFFRSGGGFVDTVDFAKRLEQLPILWYRVTQSASWDVSLEYAAYTDRFPEEALNECCEFIQCSLGLSTGVSRTRISVEQASRYGKTGGFRCLDER